MAQSLRLRLAAILLMGFASGLPLALTGGTLSIRLAEDGVSLKTIGLFSLVALSYSLKFLWAPAIDGMTLPLLTRLAGQRRGWILVTQAGLAASLLGLGFADPHDDPVRTALWAVLVAFWSATQDIAVDGLRVALLRGDEQGGGASATQIGYRLGMIVSGAGALILSGRVGWAVTYQTMAGLIGVGTLGCLLVAEPAGRLPRRRDFVRRHIIEPLAELLRRPAAVPILVFIPLFFLGDAVAGRLSGPFYLSLGFTKDDIATISKLWGVAASIAGIAVGGVIVQRLGIDRALFLCGLAKMATGLLYLVQAQIGHDVIALAATVSGEDLVGGAAETAFVSFLSRLCSPTHSATQFALLSALSSLGRVLFASSSGYVQAALGWPGFFVFSSGLGIPALLLLFVLRHKIAAAQSA